MADTIDTFEKELVHPSKTDLVKVLGLGNTKPKVPYDRNLGYLSGKLALVFLCAVIIDRVLWALALNILEPLTRYINDDFPLHVEHLDMAQFAKPMADVAQALAVCEDREVHYPDSLTGDNLRCGVATIRHEGLARFHNVASQLYYTASLILWLSTPLESRDKLVEEFIQLPIGETLKKMLLEKMKKLHKIPELKGIHKAVTGSILELLVDGCVVEGEKLKTRFNLKDFFKQSYVVPQNMTATLLRTEQVMWLTLLEMMGGASVGTLTNTRPLISGMSATSRKLEFESSPCHALTSSFGSVDPLIKNIVMRFSFVGVAEVPMDIRHWKNPEFKEEEDGAPAPTSALVVARRLDQDQDEIRYLGTIRALSQRDVIPSNGVWDVDSHAASLGKMKRPLRDLEENETSEFPQQRRWIKGPESSRQMSDPEQPPESGSMDTQEDDRQEDDTWEDGSQEDASMLPPGTAPTVSPQVPDIPQGKHGTAPSVAIPPHPASDQRAQNESRPGSPEDSNPDQPTGNESCPGTPEGSSDESCHGTADKATTPKAKPKPAPRGKGKGKGKGTRKANSRGGAKAGSDNGSEDGPSTNGDERDDMESSHGHHDIIQEPLPPADVESEEAFTTFLDKNARQGWEYSFPDPRACVHPQLRGLAPYVINKEVHVKKYGCENGQLACQPQTFNLNVRGDKQVVTGEMDLLDSLLGLAGHGDENGPRTSDSLLTVLDTDIATWPITKLRDAHSKHDLHIVPADPSTPLDFKASTCEALGINLHQTRQVHANQLRTQNDYDSEVSQTTLSEFFALLEQEDPVADNCNFLDLPLPFHQAEDPLIKKLSLLSEAAQVYTATPFPINSLNWALIATVPAMSPVHFDAGKFCTQVKVLAGHKLWLVRDMTGSSAPGNLSECDVTSLSWIGCVLGPGHKLIMRPGREHIVFTLENSLVVGSHFLSAVNLQRSMISGLREHFWGRFGTNTIHLGSETILDRILGYYYDVLLVKKSLPVEDLPERDLAALLSMALLPEMFEPQEYLGEVPDVELRDWPKTISADRRQAKIHALSMLKQLPSHLRSTVYRQLKWIIGGDVQKHLERDSESVPPL